MPLAAKLETWLNRLRNSTAPNEIIAADFGAQEIRCARLRRINGQVHLVAADILPQVEAPAGAAAESHGAFKPVSLPKELLCRHLVLCLPGQNALVKLLNIPGHPDTSSEAKIKDDMGVGTGDYRIGYKVLGYSHGRVETKLLAVAVPEILIQQHLAYFATGWPVPIAVEIAGLAAIDAFLSGYLESCPDESFGMVQFEDDVSFFAFIHKKELVLIRKYELGYNHLLSAIQTRLNVNRETALNVAADHSFDISQIVREICDPFVRQMVISKHFVERRENCRVTSIFIPDNAVALDRLAREISPATEAKVEPWDAFKAVVFQPEGLPPRLTRQHSLLAAPLGAGLGLFRGHDPAAQSLLK